MMVLLPIMKVDIIVPNTAYRETVQKFAKKSFFLREYPASNIIGGSKRKKNICGSNDRNSISSDDGYIALAKPPTTIPTRIAHADSGR